MSANEAAYWKEKWQAEVKINEVLRNLLFEKSKKTAKRKKK